MITPRTTRLLRVPDLQSMHRVLADLVVCADPLAVRAQAVIVPTRSAGVSLRRTLENLVLRGGQQVLVLPEILTRGDLYDRLYEAVPDAPPLLSEFEREVLFRRAADVASRAGTPPPFRLRPALIVEILGFYDELRRRDRAVADFDRLMTDSLGSSVEIDRGADRMMRQTRFLAAAFQEFERSVDASGSVDEHGLRKLLIEKSVPSAFTHIVLTVPDQAADPRGLWTADFDLLARLAQLERIDVVATENVLAAGFHQRIHDLLPGIEEERYAVAVTPPVLVAPEPPPLQPGVHWFTSRDREEELADVARAVRAGTVSNRIAVVFQRPLPYLYLARSVFTDAGLSYQAQDSLPLAAEPFAAAIDLVFTCVTAEATRASVVELLGSSQLRFTASSGEALCREDVVVLDAWMRDIKYLGGWDRLAALGAEGARGKGQGAGGKGQGERGKGQRARGLEKRAQPALAVALTVASELRAMAEADRASAQIAALLAFVRDHERLPDEAAPFYAAHLRARAAILSALQAIGDAHARHDDSPMAMGELAGTVRRWIEGQTFSPRTGSSGVTLLDGPSAAFADVDDMRIVGLVDSDWPERTRRSIFYPASLLNQLGWPAETDRRAAARARFNDLLRLPHRRLSISTFTLEADAIVSPSPMLEEIEHSGLIVERHAAAPGTGHDQSGAFLHEALTEMPARHDHMADDTAGWLALRESRTPGDDRAYHGFAGAYSPDAHAVSHVERYLDCPFKYFATHVLKMDEERPEESGLTPQERGQFMHEVFERFFKTWHARGHQGITGANLDEALAVFEEMALELLQGLSEVDRALERTYLLGSAAAPGLAERAFSFEIEHGTGVVERLLEYPLEGDFAFEDEDGVRTVRIRAKADRIDLLADGTLRIIDYKLGRAPKPARALQLPVYGLCASQHLEGRHGRTWTVSRAGYVAFREKNAFVALGGNSPLADALRDGQRRMLGAVSAIERGEFPPRPDEPFICTRCGYAPVCRKDYVGDE